MTQTAPGQATLHYGDGEFAVLKPGRYVTCAVSGRGIPLEILKSHDIDVAIVDFNMSPMDGVEFTRLVRNSPGSANPYLPIIMMTGHSEKSRVFEARDAGVTEFVTKPLTAKALLDRLHAVIFRPRPYVKTDSYFGPDRRRRNDVNYRGEKRRVADHQIA